MLVRHPTLSEVSSLLGCNPMTIIVDIAKYVVVLGIEHQDFILSGYDRTLYVREITSGLRFRN